jgi:hypothetical protein
MHATDSLSVTVSARNARNLVRLSGRSMRNMVTLRVECVLYLDTISGQVVDPWIKNATYLATLRPDQACREASRGHMSLKRHERRKNSVNTHVFKSNNQLFLKKNWLKKPNEESSRMSLRGHTKW